MKSEKQKRPALFYGWVIVAVTFVCNFMAIGVCFYIFNVFIEDLEILLNCNRARLSWVFTVCMILAAAYPFVLGPVIQRIGVKPVMLFGAATIGIIYLAMSRVNSYWLFLALVGLMLSLGEACLFGIAPNTVVSRWFDKSRGKALGISIMGSSLAGVFIPKIALELLKSYGLQTTFVIIGIAVMVLIIPLVFLFIREFPEDMGLKPDGISSDDTDCNQHDNEIINEEIAWSAKEVAGTSAFWMISIAYTLALAAVSAVMLQLSPHFVSLGFSQDKAVILLGAAAMLGAIAKVVWGWLTDKFEIRRVIAIMFAGQALALTIMVVWRTPTTAYIFAVLYGFSMGGVAATMPAIVARMYGSLSFPVVFGAIAPILALHGLGHPLMGMSYDKLGNYSAAYIAFIVCYVIAVILIVLVREPRKV